MNSTNSACHPGSNEAFMCHAHAALAIKRKVQQIQKKITNFHSMASSNVSKLRFMAKARESAQDAPMMVGEVPESEEKWFLSAVDETKLKADQNHGHKLISINSMPRRSYGGANPFIEQHMASAGRSKKQKTK